MQPKIYTPPARPFPKASIPFVQILSAGILFLLLASHAPQSTAHQLSVNECKEASDFIRNAAMARDNGMAESTFIDKIRDDLEIIRAFPPQLRWFVKDEDDAKLLISAAVNVFQNPKSPRAHQLEFFNACVETATPTSNTRKISM